VARRPPEPQWLTRVVVDAVHDDQVREHGGLPGIRDQSLLESVLARPQQKWHYSEVTDLPTLAASYGFGLVKNRPYCDGNKRIGFLAMVVFLDMSGQVFQATSAEVVGEILALADGRVSENELAAWIRQHGAKRK
jgi:death-on-curing protein